MAVIGADAGIRLGFTGIDSSAERSGRQVRQQREADAARRFRYAMRLEECI